MANHSDAIPQSNEQANPDEREQPATSRDDPDDWRSEFRSYLDDPE